MQPLHAKAMKIVRPQQTIQDNYAAYLTDESKLSGGNADTLVFPQSEDEVVEVLKEAFDRKFPVTVSAGRTGIVGGAVPFGGILLSLEPLNRFIGIHFNRETQSWSARVQPGITVERLDDVLKKQEMPSTLNFGSAHEEADGKRFFRESAGWFYPPDPTEKTAHLGGTATTNASGARSLKYGQTRRFIRSLRVVLSDGTLLDLKRGGPAKLKGDFFCVHCLHGNANIPVPGYPTPVVKNAAGYYTNPSIELLDLFIGSEGTLGVIVELELELRKRPESVFAGVAFFRSESDALRFVQLSRSFPDFKPSVLEYFDSYSLQLLDQKRLSEEVHAAYPALPSGTMAGVYFEQENRADQIENLYSHYETLLMQCGSDMDRTWGAVDETELSKIMDYRHALPEAINALVAQRQKALPQLHKIGTDFAVPDACLETVFHLYRSTLDPLGLEYAIFGHVGENHLHVNLLPRNEDELIKAKTAYITLAKEIVALGGTVSAEHGIGKIKKSILEIMYSEDAICQMKSIKKALDPKWILGQDTLLS